MDYTASFTAGGILFNEFEAILPYIKKREIKTFLQNEIKENKYLRINTESGRKRVGQEINKRVDTVNDEFWIFYQSQYLEERKLLLLYLCIKSYQLLWDFHFKVTIPGYWAYHHQLDDFAYKMYLDELGSKVNEVHSWSETTKKKCITNYIRMLKESGLVINGKIQKPGIDDMFYCYFIRVNELWALDAFLLSNQEKERITNFCQ
jgi:hypothetical protein